MISVVETETLYVIEENEGDCIWRNEDEKGHIPTLFVTVCLDKNDSGAKMCV